LKEKNYEEKNFSPFGPAVKSVIADIYKYTKYIYMGEELKYIDIYLVLHKNTPHPELKNYVETVE